MERKQIKALKQRFVLFRMTLFTLTVLLVGFGYFLFFRNTSFQSISEQINTPVSDQTAKNTFYLEGKHIIKGELTFELKLPDHNGPVYPGGWIIRYWKETDPLLLIVIPEKQSLEEAFAGLSFMEYKGALLQLKGSKNYGDTRITVEIFKDPAFLESSFYNNAVGKKEYCQKIVGVYTSDPYKRYTHRSVGKWSCLDNYIELN